jgi:malate synthase
MLPDMNTVASEWPGIAAASTAAGSVSLAPSRVERASEVLTSQALALLSALHRRFESKRQELLAARAGRQQAFDAGELPDFLPASAEVRRGDWCVAPVPPDLLDRCVELAGPPERRLVAGALDAPVQTYMADFEDACAPSWDNLLHGQINLADAVRHQFGGAVAARAQRPNRDVALIVRPRGWHLTEKHVRIGGAPVSASLFDFAMYLANNHEALARNSSGPYFYLPKLESHLEARLWNDVFVAAQDLLAIPRGTIKATILIETLPAAFEMDEILFELREHASGLSTGRWDYIFSLIKKFRNRGDWVLPERAALTMDRTLLRSYERLLIRTCHRRGTHAIGGMAAQMTIHSEPAANAAAMERVRADKLREAEAGLDGSWIAYPVLAPIARQAFGAVIARRAGGVNQFGALHADERIGAAELLRLPGGAISEAGIRLNIRVGVQYLEAWLRGNGNVPLYHQVEDTATAEICRAQLWQWLHHEARTSEGWVLTPSRFDALLADEIERIHGEVGSARRLSGVFPSATRLFAGMVADDQFDEFMTLPAYELLS